LPDNFNIQKVVLAPLDWGLGHATRCIPIIRSLKTNGYEVLVAAEGAQAHLLEKEFPGLQIIPLAGYRVRYSRSKWTLPFRLLLQLPRLRRMIRHEKQWLDGIIDTHKPTLVISDNRYGLSSNKIPCIFITHQLTVRAPFAWAERMIQRLLYKYIEQYNCCWVPDVAGDENVAGILSHPAVLPATKLTYIGLLSRFETKQVVRKYDYCILLSGPEPQRTLLENKLITSLAQVEGKILLVRGKPGSDEILQAPSNIEIKNHLPGDALQEALLQSEYIVCRSGYTTVMELLSLGKKAILIPTPGQTEQEYLAQKLQDEKICMRISQDEIDCRKHFKEVKNFPFQSKQFLRFDEGDMVGILKSSL
jgi:uncharacterized protein (TIGR00661 family)